jgi:hypothetical protein
MVTHEMGFVGYIYFMGFPGCIYSGIVDFLIEPEENDIAVLYDIFLFFEAEFACIA